MNSFLSTSHNRSTAIDFARLVSTDDGNQPILFEIEIDPRMKTKAFADVGKMSYYENEGEVLIMLGALFRIDKIVDDKKNRMWITRLSLASEDDYHLKETFGYMKEKIGDDTNLDSLGKILIEMGEYRQAEKCYERMLEEFQVGVGDAQAGLGNAHRKCKKYEKSLEHHKQALQIRRQLLEECDVKVGDSYRCIGTVHWEKGNYEEALVSLKRAVEIYEKAPTVDSISLARTYNNVAIAYDDMGKDDLALQYYDKTLKIQQADLPPDHPDIALTYNNLGWFYRNVGNCVKALEYYQKSLDISRKTLPPTHEDLIRTENNIEKIKEEMKK